MWSHGENVSFGTRVIPQGKWHIRVHLIENGRRLDSMEGGLEIFKTDDAGKINKMEMSNKSYATNIEDFSRIVNLSTNHKARSHIAESNFNITTQKVLSLNYLATLLLPQPFYSLLLFWRCQTLTLPSVTGMLFLNCLLCMSWKQSKNVYAYLW
jgi:hypothetical protein